MAVKKFYESWVQNVQVDSWYNRDQMSFGPNTRKIFHNYQTIYGPNKFREHFYPDPLYHHSNKAEKYRDAR